MKPHQFDNPSHKHTALLANLFALLSWISIAICIFGIIFGLMKLEGVYYGIARLTGPMLVHGLVLLFASSVLAYLADKN